MALVISLDFELMWGIRENQSIATYGRNILGGRKAIPAMLRLFAEHKVKATWAAVGMLLARNKRELIEGFPSLRPTYANANLSPYQESYLQQVGADEESDPYHFGYSLAAQILDTEGMELATHTFSHYYCIEEGQTREQFKADLEAAAAAAQRLGAMPRSIIFPRNQFNRDYLVVCSDVGLRTYRGTERAWMYRPAAGPEGLLKRAVRLADNYASLSGSNSFQPEADGSSRMVNVPASRFLRPCSRALSPLEPLQLRRITSAMTQAARRGEHFHIWWHPHNFGANTERNLENLKAVLTHYTKLRDTYGFDSRTMREFAS
jgi:peptidoglycan/xylan/chitin deacetylase (PgdA/CDA1 family)